MSRNLEIESKGELTKEEYETILASFPNETPYVQVNYYIDTPNFRIRALKCGLRIRHKNDEFELTLKVKLPEGKLEINQNIVKEQVDLFIASRIFPKGEVKDYLVDNLGIKLNKLAVFAIMETTRLDINYKGGLVSIDKSVCFGKTDYEIECEADSMDEAEKLTKEFLKKYALNYKKFSSSKLGRAIERYQNK